MLDFKDKLEKIIIDYFIKYNVDPNPNINDKVITFDEQSQIHYINSLHSKSNLNVAVSKNLITPHQYDKARTIIGEWKNNQMPFTWVVVSDSEVAKEKHFFLEQGFCYKEKIVAMVLNLAEFKQEAPLNKKEKIQEVVSLVDVKKFRSVIKSAFSLGLIDLQKYDGLYYLRKKEKINYQVYLTVDGVPAATGQFYFADRVVIIDDIATHPHFRKQGLAKKMLHHLLLKAKNMGYQQAALIATDDGFPVYQKLGFAPIKMYFDVYEINY